MAHQKLGFWGLILFFCLGSGPQQALALNPCATVLSQLATMERPVPYRIFQDKHGVSIVLLDAKKNDIQRYRQALARAIQQAEVVVSRLNGGRFAEESIWRSLKNFNGTDYLVFGVAAALISGGVYLGHLSIQEFIRQDGDLQQGLGYLFAALLSAELGPILGLTHLAERGNLNDLISELRHNNQISVAIVPTHWASKAKIKEVFKILQDRCFTEITPARELRPQDIPYPLLMKGRGTKDYRK